MMENLLPGTGTMAVTYVHCAHAHTPDTHGAHRRKCAQVSLYCTGRQVIQEACLLFDTMWHFCVSLLCVYALNLYEFKLSFKVGTILLYVVERSLNFNRNYLYWSTVFTWMLVSRIWVLLRGMLSTSMLRSLDIHIPVYLISSSLPDCDYCILFVQVPVMFTFLLLKPWQLLKSKKN